MLILALLTLDGKKWRNILKLLFNVLQTNLLAKLSVSQLFAFHFQYQNNGVD